MRTLRTAHNFSCACPIWFDVETYLLWTSYFVCPCQMISWVIKVFHIRKQKIQPNCAFWSGDVFFSKVYGRNLPDQREWRNEDYTNSSQYQYHVHWQFWLSDGFKYISYYSDSWFVCCFMWGSCTKYIVDLVVMLQFYLLCRRIEKSQDKALMAEARRSLASLTLSSWATISLSSTWVWNWSKRKSLKTNFVRKKT